MGVNLRGAILASTIILTTATFACAQSQIAFTNEADADKVYKVDGTDPVLIGSVTLDVAKPSFVLVQFSSHVTAEQDAVTCPCTARGLLRVDDEKPVAVRRINIGSAEVMNTLKYDVDRQPLTGSYVFEAAPGKHTYSFLVQRQNKSSKPLELFYPNIQAIAFAR